MEGRKLKKSQFDTSLKENREDIKIHMKNQLRSSVIIPVYNEIQIIKKNFQEVIEGIKQIFVDYEIIIAEDGSKDGTNCVLEKLVQINPKITHLCSDIRLGKGQALKRSIKIAKEKIIIFMDADLAASLKHLPQLAQTIQKGYTIAIGSRSIKGAHVKRPLIRTIPSKIYNLLVGILFRDKIHDHQCGFKAFSREQILPILNEVEDNQFFFDTELIIRTKMRGYKIKEIPVKWEEPEGRIPRFQIISDGIKMLINLLKLRIKLWIH
jgi:glycosyltransferase involved in cell wall biosynthesis